MVDPFTLIAIGAASTMLSAGGMYKAMRAGSELARLERPSIAEAPDEPFDDCFAGLPEDMAALLRQLN
jgi:hypothetical protein